MQTPREGKGGEGKGSTQKPFLTIKEACEILNVHSNTLRRWSDKGLVKAYRMNPRGDRMFKRADIAALWGGKNPHNSTSK
jgi:excisionase family DNA binding protein